MKAELKKQALLLGFELCGVLRTQDNPHADYFLNWLKTEAYGDMQWLAREPHRRNSPAQLMPEASSLIIVGLNYYQTVPPRRGKIARYALGKDYHQLMLAKLQELAQWLEAKGGKQRCYVDTGPIAEKPLAQLAGLGWQAKSTMLIHPKLGTWLFLGSILTTLNLEADIPSKDHCGSCKRCIDVCPTNAITAPYSLDARRCISYLTIEHKGSIPLEFREKIGDRLYGCDDCLEVCPWNRWAQKTQEAAFESRHYPDLRQMLQWKDQDFRDAFGGTAIFRLKRGRWLRNVCVALGNIGTAEDLPALEQACVDADPLVREHALWAVKKILS